MTDATPRIETEQTAAGECAVLRGQWTAALLASPQNWQGARDAVTGARAVPTWDLRQAEALDHLGALALWQYWGRRWPQSVQANEDQRAVLARVVDHPPEPPKPRRKGFAELGDNLGLAVYRNAAAVRDFVALVGQLLLDLLRLVAKPAKGPWSDLSAHLYRIGAQAMPITALVGFLIGVVLAYLMSTVLRQFGAETYVVNILGLAIVRELGPLLAAVLIAGRSGSAITAQIGVMRVTEELDALAVLGVPAGYRLVMPRAIALAIAMPLIAVWTSLAAMFGSMVAANITLGITPSYFMEALPRVVQASNLWLSVGKSAVNGLAIALIGCYFGLRVKPNTESLGQGTTASVVTSITAVILIDALFAIVFKRVGM